eukprot:800541_1
MTTPSNPIILFDVTTSATSREFESDIIAYSFLCGATYSSSSVSDTDTFLATHDYKRLNKICDTLQGELYKAQTISNHQLVAIKITDKTLHDEQISLQDGTHFCVAENIVNEARILKHLSVDNTSIGHHIIQYIDFFEDESHYYLVLEYIGSEIHLKQFIDTAFVHLANGKLQRKHYQTVIKYLCWQLMVTIHWMHHDMKVCTIVNGIFPNCGHKQNRQIRGHHKDMQRQMTK